MDKSWIKLPNRLQSRYINGVKAFIEYAYANKRPDLKIKCPCKSCRNIKNQTQKVVYEHIIMHGFVESYTNWVYHGETPWYLKNADNENVVHESDMGDDMQGLVHEVLGIPTENRGVANDEPHELAEGLDEEADKFFKLLKDAERELYPGCKNFTMLSFIVRLLHMKSLCRWSNRSFTMLLELLKDAFPESDMFPSSYREAWKIIKELGLDYKKIHACPNDCMLFRNERARDKECWKCHASRYKQFEAHSDDDDNKDRKIPAKLVRYFPLKPRLKRLFMSSKTASFMRWHGEERVDDGILRHPADSVAWKTFDEQHPEFASDSRNVRLGLASDGFNPFKSMNIAHSTWPVVLMPYNLPPWMCMKQPYFMLSLLIDGPRAPGNDIDVYLQPLIEELMELWNDGVSTYDASSKQMFHMRAALMWTINDFPAYANLSGWSTKGKFACPCCNKDTHSHWLKHGKKFCYMGHRRFLDRNHRFRKDRGSFDGSFEFGLKPTQLSGDDLLKQLHGMKFEYGKGQKSADKKRKRQGDDMVADTTMRYNWKKKSIFFQLPYWKQHLIRHNLDIMHIEKNVCDNILWTLLDIVGKSKDGLKARRDLKEMGIRKALHLQERGDQKVYLPPACFTMTKEDKHIFCKVLKDVKVPDGYASNISRCVHPKERNISGLKSHDSHILMQQLLPLAVRRSLPKNVSKALIELSNIFKQLYSKVSHASDFEALQDRIALTLCHLEKIFPPTFFDIMEHLPIHLADEAKLAGPVQCRSMYPIERYLCTLKNYVRTRSRPEGSIAEGYLAEECMTFCARYLHDVESKFNRPIRNYEGDGDSCSRAGRGFGISKPFYMDDITWKQAHRYVLVNSDVVEPFRMEHIALLKSERPRMGEFERNRIHNETFPKWFKAHVQTLKRTGNDKQISTEVELLAARPYKWARRYSGYIINGFRFHTRKRENRRKTQNSGVLLNASTHSFASRKDKNPITGAVNFYGVLTDIIELRYSNELKFVVFKCDWVDNNIGLKQDDFKFTLVNFNHLLYRHNRELDEPFILASQAQQVWYVKDPVEEDWHVVVTMTPRDLFDMNGKELIEDTVTAPQLEPYNDQELDETTFNRDDDITFVRAGVDGTTINTFDVEDAIESAEEESDNDDDEYATDEDDNSYDDNECDSDEDDCFSDEDYCESQDDDSDN